MARKKTEQTVASMFKIKPVYGNYEMVVVFKPFLPDKVRNDADEKVTAIVAESGGRVGTKDIWGKRYLAYPIDSHVEGYYVMYQFETVPEGVDHILKHMNRHQEVIRYMVLRREEKDTAAPKIKVKKTISSQEEALKKDA